MESNENDINSSNKDESQLSVIQLDELVQKDPLETEEVSKKLILSFTTATQKEFLSLNTKFITTQMICRISDICKEYYGQNHLECENCGRRATFSIALESSMSCSRCKGNLAEKINSNEINGNIDYLSDITEAVVRKNIKAEF